MHIPHILTASFDVVVYSVRRHGADLHEPVVLYEDGVAREVPVNYGRHAPVQVAGTGPNTR